MEQREGQILEKCHLGNFTRRLQFNTPQGATSLFAAVGWGKGLDKEGNRCILSMVMSGDPVCQSHLHAWEDWRYLIP